MKRLSVVIAVGSRTEPVGRCIQSLEAAGARECCEVIVVAPLPLKLPFWVCSLRSSERFYPALRAAGLSAAGAPRVAILSEDYTVDRAWLERALGAVDVDVTAGPTAPPPNASLASRAAWLWEYAHVAPDLPAGILGGDDATQVPAGNVVYLKERVQPEILSSSDDELEYHRRLHVSGVTFRRDPKMIAVYHPPPLVQFLRDRAAWSASWARHRARRMSRGERRLAVAGRVFLPPLLLARFAVRVARQPGRWLTCVAALPLFVAFACAQAYGEARAYLEHG
jgi:hypothetical protein